MRSPSGVAREIEDAMRRLDHEATPEIRIAIRRAARGEMLRRHDVNPHAWRDLDRLPPIECGGALDQCLVSEGNDHARCIRAGEAIERRHVEMIVMIVTDEN